MKIIFTGSSSFTGYWFVRELVLSGFQILPTCRKNQRDYEGVFKERLKKLSRLTPLYDQCGFGSEKFLQLIQEEKGEIDLFCHHAAQTTDYKSDAFDCVDALSQNTRGIQKTLEALRDKGCRKILLTGSVFESGEGGSLQARAVSPYGLSKSLTDQVFRFYADRLGMKVKKIVLPNPFGPLEEGSRFPSFLVRSWQSGQTPSVLCPSYLRDNIPVDLLAKAYARFATSDAELLRPSFYTETQGAFSKRISREIEERLDLSCPLLLKEQLEFREPRMRVNSDYLLPKDYEWSEQAFWDCFAKHFEETA